MDALKGVSVGKPQGEGVTVGERGGEGDPPKRSIPVSVMVREGVSVGDREEDIVREGQGEGVQVAGVTVMVFPMWKGGVGEGRLVVLGKGEAEGEGVGVGKEVVDSDREGEEDRVG